MTMRADGGAYWVVVLAFLIIAALTIFTVALSAVRIIPDSDNDSTRGDGDPERLDTCPLHST